MRENFKQAIDVSVPFAFWSIVFGVIFGAIAGVIFAILESWGGFPSIGKFILGSGFYAIWGAFFSFLFLLNYGLPTALFLALATVIRPMYFKSMSYLISLIVLIIIFFMWWLPSSPTEFWLIRLELEIYMHWAIFVVISLSLFAAATRITLKHPVQKPKAKRKTKPQ